ncbi:MAG: hypothetical protein KGL39_15765 [Patescibacteria group bacterium]|nr:hypothetical protein [Patescibacteria group bacterium]
MHYKNGRAAQEADPVLVKDWQGKVRVGIIYGLQSGSETCNGTVAVTVPGATLSVCVNVKDCYHADDAWAALEADPKMNVAGATPTPAEAAPTPPAWGLPVSAPTQDTADQPPQVSN